MKMAQQGDVIILRVDKIPKKNELKKVESRNGENVLAEGEVTGHYHGIDAGNTALLEAEDGTRYLTVASESVLTHQEHKAITIPEGTYTVRIVKEYDHFSEEARNVAD